MTVPPRPHPTSGVAPRRAAKPRSPAAAAVRAKAVRPDGDTADRRAPKRNGKARPRLPKAEKVYRELRDQILSGTLEPGAPIDKLALCAKLKVSRFPVAAAITRLAYERLVTIAPQHGSFVARMSPALIREFLMIRRALESEIAGLAARRFDEGARDAIRRNLAAQRDAVEEDDVEAFYALDVAFHQLIIEPMRLTHAIDTLEAARTHLERMRRMLLTPQGRAARAYAEHMSVAQAILGGHCEEARVAMRKHLDNAGETFEKIFSERPELFAA